MTEKTAVAKSVKKPLDFLMKRAKAGEKKEVTLDIGITITVPVINPETIPSFILLETNEIEDDNRRGMAVIHKTLQFFCTAEELEILGYLTGDELNEAIELANGGAELPKS